MVIHGAGRAWSVEKAQVAAFSKNLVTSTDTPALSVHQLRIEPGGEFKSHAHEGETEIQFVIFGQGQAQIGGQWEAVAEGDVVLALPGEAHAWRNLGPAALLILAVFNPPLV
jgi:quercetin dioxygenase-like cupin family protein